MKIAICVNLRRLADKIYRSRPVRNCMIIANIALMTCLIMSMAGVTEAADYLTRQENMRNFGTADNLYLSGFPVYKENLNKAYAFAQTRTYHLNDNGEKIADPLYRAAYGDETIEVYPATEEDIKKLQELLENATAPDMRSEEVLNIIMEEAEPYLAGEKTAEEAAQVIQNRMQLYMSEK